MRSVITLLVALLVPALAHADEGTVRGYVIEPNGRPIPDASVTPDAGAPVQTDGEGMFELILPTGTHVLGIAHGPLTVKTASVPIALGQTTEVVVVLGEGVSQVEIEAPVSAQPEVETTATATATGSVRGWVTDTSEHPIADARVLVRGVSADARSGADGRFELVLPAGARDLTVIHPQLTTQVVRVVVPAGGEVEARVRMLARAATLAEMVILIPKPDYGSVTQQLALRKEAAAVMDSVGLDEIKKSPDSTASSATRRIVGASVVGGAYLNVRGLQGRYTNVLLNGVELPSTDPDLPGFQIDLFPVSLLTSLNVTKAFTPDIPGDFAGGSLDILTRDFPDKLSISANAGFSGASDTFAQKTLGYRGGSIDFLGFDDGTRALPDAVPDQRVSSGRNGLPPDQIQAIGRSFQNVWNVDERRAIPDLSLGLSLGDSVELGDDRLGFLVTAGYRYGTERNLERITNVKLQGEQHVVESDELAREVGQTSSQLGLLGTASYRVGQDHELKLVSLFTQTGDDRTSRTTGIAENEGTSIEQTQLRFIARRLWFNQILGRHQQLFDAIDLDWQVNMALIARDQPDTRDLLYALGPQGFVYRNVTGSGERLFTELGQTDVGGGVDLSYPLLEELKLKGGYLMRFSDRNFSARRFGTRYVGTADQRLLAPEALFAPESYGPILELLELTRPDDGYAANLLLNAGYLMGDWFIAKAVRVIGGARLEAFNQQIEASSPFSTDKAVAASTSRTDFDVLPSVGVIVPIAEQMNIRASYGGTVARP